MWDVMQGAAADWLGRSISVGSRCTVKPPGGRGSAEADKALRPRGHHDWLDKKEHPGVVRYIGRLKGRGRAVYVGVELADHSEGLSTGQASGAVYFEPHASGHCLFCKPGSLVLTDGVHSWGKLKNASAVTRGGGGAAARKQPGRGVFKRS